MNEEELDKLNRILSDYPGVDTDIDHPDKTRFLGLFVTLMVAWQILRMFTLNRIYGDGNETKAVKARIRH